MERRAKDLLDDEGGDGLGELAAGLHDAEGEGDDLRGEEEVDHVGIVHLDEGTNDTEGGEAEILEGARLGGRVEEGGEEEGDVG